VRAIWSMAAVLGLALAAAPAPRAEAQTGGRPVRVIMESVNLIGGLQPRFVIDGVITPGENIFHNEVQGWLASLPPGAGADTLEGSCVENQCALTAALSSGKMALSADLVSANPPTTGRLILSDDDGRKIGEGPMRITTITGPIPGLGELAPVNAVGAVELSDILMWNDSPTDFSHIDDGPIGWLQRQALAKWQGEQGRHANGLVLKDELALLRSRADKAKAKAGWAAMGGPAQGWTAGYPAALLPKAEVVNRWAKRFSSADGRAMLLVAVQPPMSAKAFDAFVAQQTADRPGVANRTYTRVNNDMEISYQQGGKVISSAYHNRARGFVRMEFSRPIEGAAAYEVFDMILPRSLRVTDQLAPP
jgi:hypothetical protein